MLTKEGFKVVVESGAGVSASFTDEAYEAAGARVVKGEEAWKSDIVVKVNMRITDTPPAVAGVFNFSVSCTVNSFAGEEAGCKVGPSGVDRHKRFQKTYISVYCAALHHKVQRIA